MCKKHIVPSSRAGYPIHQPRVDGRLRQPQSDYLNLLGLNSGLEQRLDLQYCGFTAVTGGHGMDIPFHLFSAVFWISFASIPWPLSTFSAHWAFKGVGGGRNPPLKAEVGHVPTPQVGSGPPSTPIIASGEEMLGIQPHISLLALAPSPHQYCQCSVTFLPIFRFLAPRRACRLEGT